MQEISFLKTKLSASDIILFARRLSFLLGAGISLPKALDILRAQSRKRIIPILKIISEHVHHGERLSAILGQFPKSFPLFMVRLIKAGEDSGQLKESLVHLAHEIERRKALSQKIISACLYPSIIVLGTILLSGFLIFIIFPKIRTLFQNMHMQLPITTRIIIFLSDAFHTHNIVIIAVIFFLTGFFVYFYRTSVWLKRQKDYYILKLPALGYLYKNFILSSFFRILGMLLRAHIPLDVASMYASESISNTHYKQILQTVSLEVSTGKMISSCLSLHKNLFPENTVQLIEVGEMSGNLSETLLYLSDMLDQEIESSLKILVTLIEPILMIGMGCIVGFISLSIISPIYEITQNIKP